MAATRPTWRTERALWREGRSRVAGVDEVGRGPLAGPVLAGAVVLPFTRARWAARLRDSKLLSPAVREELAAEVRERCDWGLGAVSTQVIDQIGIGPATRLAMRRAVLSLHEPPDALIHRRPPVHRVDRGAARADRRRCAMQIGGRRQHRREGRARPPDGRVGCTIPRLRAGAQQGVRLGGTHRGAAQPRVLDGAPALVRSGARRGAGRRTGCRKMSDRTGGYRVRLGQFGEQLAANTFRGVATR